MPISAINQTLEIAEDDEPAELDEENLLAERRLEQTLNAIQERIRVIGPAYPYAVDPRGVSLSLKTPIGPGGHAYLFCLIVSSAAPEGPLAGDGPWRPDLPRARGLFQICATIACAGHTEGPAFSVGWPRPDSSAFLDKLRDVYARFGDGRVHDKTPAGAPLQVKDDEIDVIAWKHTNDVRPPVGYFLGQAATGSNWPVKGLVGRAGVFHGTWFSQVPAAQVRVGTIMPFYLPSPPDADPTDYESQEEIEGNLRRLALEHGDLLHRHRVARYLEKGIELHGRGIGPIERIDDLGGVVEFVESYRIQLRNAGS